MYRHYWIWANERGPLVKTRGPLSFFERKMGFEPTALSLGS